MIFLGDARLSAPNLCQEQATELAEISVPSDSLGGVTGKILVLAAGVMDQVLEPETQTPRN